MLLQMTYLKMALLVQLNQQGPMLHPLFSMFQMIVSANIEWLLLVLYFLLLVLHQKHALVMYDTRI